MPPIDKPKNRHRPLRFALGLASTCALIVAIPIVGPRLMAGSSWDEPDVKPVWKADERANHVESIEWSADGKRVSYLVTRYANDAERSQTLTEVERIWPDGKELARSNPAQRKSRNFDEVGNRISPPRTAQNKPILRSKLELLQRKASLEVDRGRPVEKRFRSGHIATEYVNPRLLLKRNGKVLRTWALPQLGSDCWHTPLLSRDGRVASALTRGRGTDNLRFGGDERHLWDLLRIGGPERYEIRSWRTSDGKLLRKQSLENRARGLTKDGRLWLGKLDHFLTVGQSELWFTVAPKILPRDAETRFARGHKNIEGGLPMLGTKIRAFAEAKQELLDATVASDSVLLFDPVNRRTRWLAPAQPKPVVGIGSWGSTVDFSWPNLRLSPDNRFLVGILRASGSSRTLEKSNGNSLFAWDFRSGQALWQRTPEKNNSGIYNWTGFSPDVRKLAVSIVHSTGLRHFTSIRVFDLPSGSPIGPPLLEESPRQRFEDRRAQWQQPFSNTARRLSQAFAAAAPPPPSAPLPGDGFRFFDWAPDSRHIVVRHEGGVVKVWRVPDAPADK